MKLSIEMSDYDENNAFFIEYIRCTTAFVLAFFSGIVFATSCFADEEAAICKTKILGRPACTVGDFGSTSIANPPRSPKTPPLLRVRMRKYSQGADVYLDWNQNKPSGPEAEQQKNVMQQQMLEQKLRLKQLRQQPPNSGGSTTAPEVKPMVQPDREIPAENQREPQAPATPNAPASK